MDATTGAVRKDLIVTGKCESPRDFSLQTPRLGISYSVGGSEVGNQNPRGCALLDLANEQGAGSAFVELCLSNDAHGIFLNCFGEPTRKPDQFLLWRGKDGTVEREK